MAQKAKSKKKGLDLQGAKEANHSKELTSTAKILTSVFSEIESRSLGTSVAGIPVNFYDFDAMTQGLQRGPQIVIGGKPTMGKTSISLNMAKNIDQLHDLPVWIWFGDEPRGLHLSSSFYGSWN